MANLTPPLERDRVDRTLPAFVEEHHEGLWTELVSQGQRPRVVFVKPLPIQLLQRFARAAVSRATIRQHDDGKWFAEVPLRGFEGVWAKKESPRDALEELEEVVFDWALLKIQQEDRDLPELEGINLNVL